MELIGRPEFDRISLGTKQYAKGDRLSISDITNAETAIIVWYHDRPYHLPPVKHTGKIELTRKMNVKRNADGSAMPGSCARITVRVEPDIYNLYEVVDITGTISVISDGKALHNLLSNEPPNMLLRGTYVPHKDLGLIHIRPHVIYKNDNLDLVVTYKDGLYLVSKHMYDGKVFSKPILLSPTADGVYAFIQRSAAMNTDDLIATIQTREADGWTKYPDWGVSLGMFAGTAIAITALSRNHLHNIVMWMTIHIFNDIPEYINMYTPEFIAVMCYEYTLRYGYTIPTKRDFTRPEIYEEGRRCLPDGIDYKYITTNPLA